ncbi:hypothetical protein C4573_03935 [Candidatus Woesearchaeota archaeon]|nr:MAG: hypothetical protein C4573_03935 [Candidatus Woesearchaeota archaeon]
MDYEPLTRRLDYSLVHKKDDLESRVDEESFELDCTDDKTGFYYHMKQQRDFYELVSNDPKIAFVSDYLLGEFVLGMINLYSNAIFINDKLPKDTQERVLYHEKNHRHVKDEITNRVQTNTENPGADLHYAAYAP